MAQEVFKRFPQRFRVKANPTIEFPQGWMLKNRHDPVNQTVGGSAEAGSITGTKGIWRRELT